MQKLLNRVALVTGAGRGIGRAIAIGFARQGARVALAARTRPELEEVVGEIHAAGRQSRWRPTWPTAPFRRSSPRM